MTNKGGHSGVDANIDITKQDIEQFAPRLRVISHIGFVLWWYQSIMEYRGSPENLKSILASTTLKNMIFGWWSPMSLFINPVVTMLNWIRFFRYRVIYKDFESSPREFIMSEKKRFIDAPAKTDKNLKRALLSLVIVVTCLILIVFVSNIMNN